MKFRRQKIKSMNFQNLRSNIREGMTSEFIKECANSEIRDPHCPVFKINQILKLAEPDENEQKIMLLKVTTITLYLMVKNK